MASDSPPATIESPNSMFSGVGQPASAPAAAETTKGWPGGRPAVAAAIAVLVVAAGVVTWRLESQVRASAERVNAMQQQLRLTTETAARQVNDTQVQATRAISEAQEVAARAQMISDVLAAPDLVKFPLAGRDTLATATGQVMWSRSRGVVVFSASGLSAPPQDSTYQFWLLTRTGAVSAATFVPDASGRVTVAATPKSLPPLVGAIVTMERKGGNDTPSGQPLLTRVQAPSPT
jgi:hypothetical protein